ncbi:MAG TPA: hemerythrin domain-containing protein [Candidatus Sulfotelmatobacter sp.]|nr:hemerythrin domain-containing protein [Candidatus Sulfotelmatobacter sp.]
MLRDKNLIPLSHQHQHALALCVRIERASPIPEADLPAWQAEVAQQFENEIRIHFAAEEEILFPVARQFKELTSLVAELISEHVELRTEFNNAAQKRMSSGSDLRAFANRLSNHIRKEERLLFERLQQLMGPREMTAVGHKLDRALKKAVQACALPNEKTRLRSTK